jgi:hypothetical protein
VSPIVTPLFPLSTVPLLHSLGKAAPDVMKRLKRTSLVSATIVLLVAAATAVALNGCAKKADSLDTVRIGVGTTVITGLIYIADEKGFFKQRGISAAIGDYDTGVMAVDALFADKADVATAAEFVMVRRSFDHRDLRTFGQKLVEGPPRPGTPYAHGGRGSLDDQEQPDIREGDAELSPHD